MHVTDARPSLAALDFRWPNLSIYRSGQLLRKASILIYRFEEEAAMPEGACPILIASIARVVEEEAGLSKICAGCIMLFRNNIVYTDSFHSPGSSPFPFPKTHCCTTPALVNAIHFFEIQQREAQRAQLSLLGGYSSCGSLPGLSFLICPTHRY